MASSDVASKPRVPNEASAASTTRSFMRGSAERGAFVPIYQMVDRVVSRDSAALAGKRIAITGTTGFLGTALLERLLRAVPDADIVLLLRGPAFDGQQRANREIFRNGAFDRLRAEFTGRATGSTR